MGLSSDAIPRIRRAIIALLGYCYICSLQLLVSGTFSPSYWSEVVCYSPSCCSAMFPMTGLSCTSSYTFIYAENVNNPCTIESGCHGESYDFLAVDNSGDGENLLLSSTVPLNCTYSQVLIYNGTTEVGAHSLIQNGSNCIAPIASYTMGYTNITSFLFLRAMVLSSIGPIYLTIQSYPEPLNPLFSPNGTALVYEPSLYLTPNGNYPCCPYPASVIVTTLNCTGVQFSLVQTGGGGVGSNYYQSIYPFPQMLSLIHI